MMGVNIPLVPFQHQYLVTEAIEGVPPDMPTLRDKDSLLYYKEEVGGLVMGGYERDGIPWSIRGVPKGFTQELLEPDFDHFESISQAAVNRTPCLGTAGIARLVNGPEAFTPDGNCMLGPAPELDNCFVAVGFNAFGIAAGGGAGRMVAEWIVEGEPSLNIWPLDIRRFGQYHRSLKYNVERTKEIYGKHYTISWPHEEHDSARGVKRSPLYWLLKEKGAVYGAKYGWERSNWFAPAGVPPEDSLTFGIPNWFEHVAAEHRAAREAVVLIDQSSFSKFEVTGAGALAFLNHVAAANLDRPVGSTVYTQLCNERGGIEADITISRVEEERFFVITGTAFGVHDFMWLKRHLPKDGSVSLRDVTSSLAMINVCGPSSRELLQRLSEDDFSNDAFPFGQCRQVVIGYAPVLALRVTYIGELGYELYMPPEYAANLYESLWAAGQDLGHPERRIPGDRFAPAGEGLLLLGRRGIAGLQPLRCGDRFCRESRQGSLRGAGRPAEDQKGWAGLEALPVHPGCRPSDAPPRGRDHHLPGQGGRRGLQRRFRPHRGKDDRHGLSVRRGREGDRRLCHRGLRGVLSGDASGKGPV